MNYKKISQKVGPQDKNADAYFDKKICAVERRHETTGFHHKKVFFRDS